MKNITKDSLKDQIDLKNGSEGFIKVTDNPVSSLNSEQKVILNRNQRITLCDILIKYEPSLSYRTLRPEA